MPAKARPKSIRAATPPQPSALMARPSRVGESALVALIIAAVVFSFWPSLSNGFVDWDDAGMFLTNYDYRGLSPAHLKWMFTTIHYAHYHPLTWMTLGLDYTLWGMKPLGYHLTNVLLHAINAVLFYFLLKAILQTRLSFWSGSSAWTIPLSATAGALLFALHPLRVESVAWATERRDVLSGLFYLLTLLAYLRAHRQVNQRKKWLSLSILCFFLSFLCKAWGMTLPIVLVILDFYPLGRLDFKIGAPAGLKAALLEKAPFALIAAVFAGVALHAQTVWGIKAHDFGFASRLMNCAYGLVFYPWKTFAPFELSPIYPLDPQFNPWETKYVLCLCLAIAITLLSLLGWKRFPWAFSAWLSYAAIVSPVLGAAQSGEQIVADRYSYLACLPFAVLVAAGLGWVLRKSKGTLSLWSLSALFLVAATALGSGVLAWQQTRAWHDDLSLWNQALKVDPENWVALNGRGKYYLDRNELEKALQDFSLAIKLNPGRVAPWTNRGMIYQTQGKYDEALSDYNTSLKLKPNHSTYNNRGALKEVRGDLIGALSDYSLALQLDPKFHSARLNRGNLRQRQGDLQGALEDFSLLIRCAPDDPLGWSKRGGARLALGEIRGAAEDFSAALRLAPANWAQRASVEQQLTQALNLKQTIHN